jgi:hypothetical protein
LGIIGRRREASRNCFPPVLDLILRRMLLSMAVMALAAKLSQ